MDLKEYRITDRKGAFITYHDMKVTYEEDPNAPKDNIIRLGDSDSWYRTVYPNGLIIESFTDIDGSKIVRTNGVIIKGERSGEYIFVLPLEPNQK